MGIGLSTFHDYTRAHSIDWRAEIERAE